MFRLRHLSMLFAIVVAGCIYKPPAIPLIVEPAGFEALAGEWTGDYMADDEYGRGGRISFRLTAGEDHAHGDVLMVPTGRRQGYERYDGSGPVRPDADRPPSEALSIRFVRLTGGVVSGVLDPYWDPDRKCQVSTTFVGDLRGDVIEGTFRSRFAELGSEAGGHWRVTRRPAGR